ncbi:MAG TPA: hypothetical protein PLJ27_17165, partial [Polyangiaceae bacterium]|nr:hypothetical protein [Polyangiaceae bacterium]
CKVTGSMMRPLIVEWPAADRASLEVLAQRGTVVVRYSGCEMEVLPRCKAPGVYRYVPTTRKSERVVIQDEDELYANLPIGAAKLEGKLRRAGQLDVNMNVVGQYDAEQREVSQGMLEGDCRKATHYITGLTVGAFEFSAGGTSEAGAGASGLGVGVGGETARRREILNSDGDVESCEKSSLEDDKPPAGCGGLLRLELAELSTAPQPIVGPAVAEPVGEPTGDEPSCPEGMVRKDGQCVALAGIGVGILGTAILPQTSRLHVQVYCGGDFGNQKVGQSDGLKVWVDDVLVPALEEVRVPNPMLPGDPGILLHVVYEVEPGDHKVRVGSDGCEDAERLVKVNPGSIRLVQGRLRSTAWYARPPAASAGFGVGLNYMWFKPEFISVETASYEHESMDARTMSGLGLEIPFSTQYIWMAMGFGWTGGNFSGTAPECKYDVGNCLPKGTEVTGKIKGYHVPIWAAGRLPFVYGAALLGSGIEFNILSMDFNEGENNFGTNTAQLNMHVPIWAGLEFRPTCGLSVSGRAFRGFGLSGNMPPYNAAMVSLDLFATANCGDAGFGIQ